MGVSYTPEPTDVHRHRLDYRRDSYRDGELVHSGNASVYLIDRRDGARLLKSWNSQGAVPSQNGGRTYRYTMVGEA